MITKRFKAICAVGKGKDIQEAIGTPLLLKVIKDHFSVWDVGTYESNRTFLVRVK